MELARLRLKLNELKDSMDTAIMEQDFLLAQTLKQEMDTVSAEQVKLHEEVQREKANIQKVNIFYAVCCCQTSANRGPDSTFGLSFYFLFFYFIIL